MFDKTKTYKVSIILTDQSVDVYKWTGDIVIKFQERVWQSGYVRKEKNKNQYELVSPFVIIKITIILL